jgi:hypothetical protein
MIAHAAAQSAHRIPHPTSVTVAKRPSIGTGCRQESMISGKKKEEYFWREDWTGQIRLIGHENFIAQDRMEVAVDLKVYGAWMSVLLQGGATELSLLTFGLSCRIADLYERTPVPRSA